MNEIIGDIKFGREIGKSDKRRRFIWASCSTCGKERWVVYLPKKQKPSASKCAFCSGMETARLFLKKGAGSGCENPNWRKGRIIRSDGYVMVYVPPNDFFHPMVSNKLYIMEHRLVMAKHLNRCLLKWETVHHKNGIRSDNRIENLELFPAPHKHNGISYMRAYIKQLENRISELELLLTRSNT